MRPIVAVEPPALDSFAVVMRRLDRDPRNAHHQRFVTYDLSLKASAIEHPDGKIATTLFFPADKDSSVIRARRYGWIDVTSQWKDDGSAPKTQTKADTATPAPVISVRQKSTISEALGKMTWPALQAMARERGTRQTGSRDSVEKGIVASYGSGE